MNIRLMRKIDYYLGIPLCFILDVVGHILKPFFLFKKSKDDLSKILFIKLSELGSIVLAYPLVKQVREEFPQAEMFFLTFKENAPVPEMLNMVLHQNILTIRDKSFYPFILDTLRVIRKLRREKIDIVFDLELFSRFTAILAFLTGAPKRVGFYRYIMEGLYRGNFLTHRVQYNPLLHISKSYLSLRQAIKTAKKFTPELDKTIGDEEIALPRFTPSEEVKREMRLKLKESNIEQGVKLILINSGEGNIPLREWSLENFITLAKKLLAEDNYIIIIGAKGVSKKVGLFSKSLNNERCIDFSNKTTLSELLTLFTLSNILLTNDCGLAHLASLTPIKKFILFGPESPQIYSPLGKNTWTISSNLPCSPCLSAFNHRNSACKDNKCLKAIKSDEVYEMIKYEA